MFEKNSIDRTTLVRYRIKTALNLREPVNRTGSEWNESFASHFQFGNSYFFLLFCASLSRWCLKLFWSRSTGVNMWKYVPIFREKPARIESGSAGRQDNQLPPVQWLPLSRKIDDEPLRSQFRCILTSQMLDICSIIRGQSESFLLPLRSREAIDFCLSSIERENNRLLRNNRVLRNNRFLRRGYCTFQL